MIKSISHEASFFAEFRIPPFQAVFSDAASKTTINDLRPDGYRSFHHNTDLPAKHLTNVPT
jgi:hypothetical protein